MEMQIAKLKQPATMIGGLMLVFLGVYIAMSSQLSISTKDESVPAKSFSKTARVSMGVFILVIGAIITWTHLKKND